jgi:hypothetical protein
VTANALRRGVFASVLLVAVAARLFAPAETDIAWLLTVGEKWLDGARLYRDIVETNPPGAVLLYLPAILLGRATSFAPEIMVALLVFLSAGASLWLAWRIARPPRDAWPAAAFLLGLLLILPAYAFGQRDHAALLLLLPALACYATRADDREVSAGAAIAAGVCAGLALCLRPHYALAVAAPLLFAIWRKGWRTALGMENAALLATCLAYGVLVWSVFPAYVQDVMPQVAALYMPMRRPWSALLVNPSLLVGVAALAGIWACCRACPTPIVISALAGAGALAAMLLQGKGWPYHGYPALALLLFALGCAVWASPRRLAGLVVLAALLSVSLIWMETRRDTDALTAAVARLAPPHPKVITISPDIALGQPLTRAVAGNWVGTSWGQWISQGAKTLSPRAPEQKDRQTAWAARERATLANDMRRAKPDVVLIEQGEWHRWAFADSDIAQALAAYRQGPTVAKVEIWLRR